MRRILPLALAAALAPAAATAQAGGDILVPGSNDQVTRVATRGAAFLSLGIGARPLALGGAGSVTTGDLSAAYWNVAGLADVQTASAFASHERLYGSSGLTNTAVVAAIPLFGGALGVSFTSFSSGDITRTTEYYPDGGDPAQGLTVRWNATNVGVHYARPFTDRLAAGLTLKRANEGISFASATYFGADAGVRFRTGLAGSTLGFSVANLGTSARMEGAALDRRLVTGDDPNFPSGRPQEITLRAERLQLPTTLRFGVQTDLVGGAESIFGPRFGTQHALVLFTDITDGVDTGIMPALAAEYGFLGRFFLRGGGRFLNDDRRDQGAGISFTAGGGVSLPIGERRFVLDYAWRSFGQLNDNQVVSFQIGN